MSKQRTYHRMKRAKKRTKGRARDKLRHHSAHESFVMKKNVLKGTFSLNKTNLEGVMSHEIPLAYVDGSYMQHENLLSYGVHVMKEGEVIQRDYGLVLDKEFTVLQSVGAELYASLRAVEWAIANQYEHVIIVYDCEGIIQIIQSNKRKADGRLKFNQLMRMYSQHIQIHFKKANTPYLLQHHKSAHDLSRIASDLMKISSTDLSLN